MGIAGDGQAFARIKKKWNSNKSRGHRVAHSLARWPQPMKGNAQKYCRLIGVDGGMPFMGCSRLAKQKPDRTVHPEYGMERCCNIKNRNPETL